MNRLWSILFFAVPVLSIGVFLLAAFGVGPLAGAWMPESYSDAGDTIDHLFNFIHIIAAGIMLATGLPLAWILWKYSAQDDDRPALYLKHNTFLEVIWTFIPGVILVFIAFYQMDSWADNKMNRPQIEVGGQQVDKPPMVLVKAKQFGWEFHYAGSDGEILTADDIYVEDLLVVPDDEEIVLQLESRDVIHSFFVPELRLKQDIVPGMIQYAWFKPNRTGQLTIVCAELCGRAHYDMKAVLKILPREEYLAWMEEQTAAYRAPIAENVQPEADASASSR